MTDWAVNGEQRWFIRLDAREGVAPATLADAPDHELRAHRVSSANLVEPLIDGRAYMDRWFREAESLATHGDGAVLLHAGWRLQDVAVEGRLATGATALEVLHSLCDRGVEVVVRLSGHGFGLVNLTTARGLRDVCAVLDRDLRWPSSHHGKFTVFAAPGTTRALLGSIDLTRLRWDTSDHLPHDLARYRSGQPTHDVGLAVDGPAAHDLARLHLGAHLSDPHRRGNGRGPTLPAGSARPPGCGSAVQVLATVPYRPDAGMPAKEHSVFDAYCNALRQARRYVYIEDQYVWAYFSLDGPLPAGRADPLALLIAAVARGVDIFVVMPGPRRWPGCHIFGRRRHAALSALVATQAAGSGRVVLAIPCRGGTDVYVHSKLLVVDDEFCLVGSANLNRRSMLGDFETAAGVADPAVARELRQRLWSEHLGIDPQDLADDTDARERFIVTVAARRARLRSYPLPETVRPDSRIERAVWDVLIDPVGG